MEWFRWDLLTQFWSIPELTANYLIFVNIFGAFLLGLLVGYERYYQGRAAGMRTYGLVCMASAAVTAICGYSGFWFGAETSLTGVEPTRVIQGIVTGIGFLGAGVILREGMNITGLSTAASIWCSSIIGIMMGTGVYIAAILLACLSALSMTLIPIIERHLPSHKALVVVVHFKRNVMPAEQTLREAVSRCGYSMVGDTISIAMKEHYIEWHFVVAARIKSSDITFEQLSHELAHLEGIDTFSLSHARN